ncbi:shikimate dehydrogenase [Sphingomonas sp.]|uniref:shikimate dehydrogenase n=1 Tax=Sphingomonas sp. TaxID=28214 RepID=UPI00325FAE58
MTRPFAEVIGDPIAHSKSPLIHNFWLGKLGIDAEYRSRRVSALAAADYFTQVRADADWLGCNVTMPLKGLVGGEIDRIDRSAAKIGAINTVVREGDVLAGYNSDGAGFFEPFEGRFDDDRRRTACLMGTGGAARSIAIALLEAEFNLTVLGRSQQRAADFALSIGAPLEIRPGAIGDPLRDPALLVNATSLGMAGQPDLPVSLDSLGPDAIVYDIVYSPLETPLLAAARQRGLATIDGLQMLVGQAAVAFEKFFGVQAPRQHDAELRERLIA